MNASSRGGVETNTGPILLVGGGAREHALGVALAAEGHALHFAPGNAGTLALGENHAVAATDLTGLVALARRLGPRLTVVGPEAPLTLGLVDALAEHGLLAFGPSAEAARLEGSKAFMKAFLRRHAIPTADFQVFEDEAAAAAYVKGAGRPLVVKADGLAAGKGVVVAMSAEEALAAVHAMMGERIFGDAGAKVVVEELLPGAEASFHVVCDGVRAVPLAPAQDHKRVFDGDRGPNTGGMGAYAPAPVVTPALHAEVMAQVVEPTLRGMAAEGTPFRGVLFVGLMIHEGKARVLEFNVRFGDPETCVIVPLYPGSFFELLEGSARGDLARAAKTASTAPRGASALAVVVASEGYPEKPRTGDIIEGLLKAAAVEGATVLHAGTAAGADGTVVTAGGRVLTIVGQGATLADAARRAYRAAAQVTLRGGHYRRDIGHRALA